MEENICVYPPLSNMGPVKKIDFYIFSFYLIIFSKLSSKSHHFNIWQKIITNLIMADRIGRYHKLGKQSRKRPDMNSNILAFPF